VGDIGTYLDVVELLLVDIVWNILPTAVPRHFVLGITLVDVCCQAFHLVGRGIAPHKADTGDALAMLCHQAVYGFGVEWFPCVRPQIGAVASWTPTGTPCYVDGQRGLVRYLLEYNVGVEIL
jgi:hypothetical protein